MAASVITEAEIRNFIMDKQELNPMLNDIRFKPADIEQAMVNVIDQFNFMAPPTRIFYTVESFPSRYILLMGVIGYLLRGAAVNEAGNQYSFQAADFSATDKDKAQIFTSLGAQFSAEFKEMATNLKMSQNLSQVYGHVHSEYVHRAR